MRDETEKISQQFGRTKRRERVLSKDKSMAEKMLVTQALDERDLLKKKINQKIEKLQCVDYAKNNEEKGIDSKMSREEFAQEAKAAYQQITDLIARYQRIEAAIIASNAATVIKTSFGEYTVAAAIALRNRMREKKTDSQTILGRMRGNTEEKRGDGCFEEYLADTITYQYLTARESADSKNKNLDEQAENMRLSILGKDSKVKDDKPLAVVDTYISQNRAELMDPLEAMKKVEELRMRTATLLKEIDTQIKISNATTLIAID